MRVCNQVIFLVWIYVKLLFWNYAYNAAHTFSYIHHTAYFYAYDSPHSISRHLLHCSQCFTCTHYTASSCIHSLHSLQLFKLITLLTVLNTDYTSRSSLHSLHCLQCFTLIVLLYSSIHLFTLLTFLMITLLTVPYTFITWSNSLPRPSCMFRNNLAEWEHSLACMFFRKPHCNAKPAYTAYRSSHSLLCLQFFTLITLPACLLLHYTAYSSLHFLHNPYTAYKSFHCLQIFTLLPLLTVLNTDYIA